MRLSGPRWALSARAPGMHSEWSPPIAAGIAPVARIASSSAWTSSCVRSTLPMASGASPQSTSRYASKRSMSHSNDQGKHMFDATRSPRGPLAEPGRSIAALAPSNG